MKNYRAKRTSAEDKAKHNVYNKKSRAAKTSPEDKARHNEYMKEYRAKKSKCDNDIEKSISLFHEIISKGPMHICTCCDQLWYKHSVKHVNKLRKSNPDIEKYLCNIISVDNMEWVCKTCNSYLIKNKIPPYAVFNGMKFPVKPAFFDLNELECRLIAPRIAFQKLMQAPRGKQLKIHGNVVNVPANVVDTVNLLP